MELQEFLNCLATKTGTTPKKSGEGYSSSCPAHDDKQPSLSITQDNGGKILIHCFAGCKAETVCTSLGLTVSALFSESPNNRASPKQTIYSYVDEAGKELYRKIRIEPGFNGKSKSFYSERHDENGKVIRNLKRCRKVLYRLPDVIKGITEGQPIFLVEGEKDADKLAGYNLMATTSLDSLKWEAGFTQILNNADIIILYDMDDTGVKRKDILCTHLYKKVKRLRVVDLPGLVYQASHGQDISDWLAMGHTVAELLELVSKTPDYASSKAGGLRVVTVNEFLLMALPKREMLLAPFLPSQGLAMIYAKRGLGKTHIALGIASAVARGGIFLKWTAQHPRKVLFIDGEMPGVTIQERLKRIAVTDELNEQARGNLRLITPDLQDCPMPDLSTKIGRDAIETFVDECDLVIIDNISSLFRSGIENEADS